MLFICGNKNTVNDHALCVTGSGAGGQCEEGILRGRNDPCIITDAVWISTEGGIYFVDIYGVWCVDIEVRLFLPALFFYIGF